ncbi:MAG TPA: site-2 protease family protein [Polyangiaceae bacterium]|nr:site-2 protease family protein [Polyangiaceae bacterium]
MNWLGILVTIIGLAALMIVHESGHHFVARWFGMRVVRFSIGFGPPLWRVQPKGSETIYQVALIPFIAYVQIAGMNPFEDFDPNDKASYANASLPARVSTVVAGPLANYLFASVLFFAAFVIGGKPGESTVIEVMPGGAAAQANLKDGDKVLSIDGVPTDDFESMRKIVVANPSRDLLVKIQRDGKPLDVHVTPEPKGENGGGIVGVVPMREPMTVSEAALRSAIAPAAVVESLVVGLVRIVTGREKADLTGPVGIVKFGAKAATLGIEDFLAFMARLSAYLGGFNLLPFPALDGGRLVFLGYEAVARRKPNARVEAHIHAVGLLMFLALMFVVSVFDIRR